MFSMLGEAASLMLHFTLNSVIVRLFSDTSVLVYPWTIYLGEHVTLGGPPLPHVYIQQAHGGVFLLTGQQVVLAVRV